VVYNTVSALLQVPTIVYAAFEFGPIGVAWVWLGFRVLSFGLWSPYVHHLFAPGVHVRWMTRDIAFPALASLVCVPLLHLLVGPDGATDRWVGLAGLMVATGVSAALAFAMSFSVELRKRFGLERA
jgi:hypothetical protein